MSVQVAMPLFSTVAAPKPEDVLASWRTLFPKLNVPKHERTKDVDQFSLDGRAVMVMHVAVPVPDHEADAAVRSSWMWKGPADAVANHKSHAIVTSVGTKSPLEAAWDVARVCAAVMRAGEPAALYWGSAMQVHLPKIAAAFAVEDSAPVPLFVGITISAESMKGPFSAATHGLDALGLKEFEVLDTTMGIGDLRMKLLDLAMYVLDKGPVLKDGQTFGPDPATKWAISHRDSKLMPGRKVIVLGIP